MLGHTYAIRSHPGGMMDTQVTGASGDTKILKSVCRSCHGGCSALMHVKQGYLLHARDYFLAARELDDVVVAETERYLALGDSLSFEHEDDLLAVPILADHVLARLEAGEPALPGDASALLGVEAVENPDLGQRIGR